MCGICGVISQKPAFDLECVKRMQNALRHRGPDGAGEYHKEHIALAMRRLSIIDPLGGWQPLYNEDRSLILIANAEIYNFVELRAELEAQGHRFRTGSDCETIVHLYEEHGHDCVCHLRGMFAFALWDETHQCLLLARDRMGEKPLYLYESNGQVVFASELKALLCSGLVPFELDPVALDFYFHYQYVPEPATPIQGIRKLPAAHILKVDTHPWRARETCYWRMEEASPIEGDPGELIRAELETVSKLVIRSDVPVGVALSGGLDSSAIAALASQEYPGSMHSFSIGYPGRPPSDERADAEALANYLGMPFHDVELTTDDMVSCFPEMVYWRDDPIADVSGYGYYAVMKLAREHGVPVVLQGQGGDELFWGYPKIRRAVEESKRKSAAFKRGRVALRDYMKMKLPDGWSSRELWDWCKSVAGIRTGWMRFQYDRSSPPDQLIFYDLSPDFQMACNGVKHIYTQTFLDRVGDASALDLFTFPRPWPQIDVLMTRLICETYLVENGIAQGDRLSMASSIELRLPLVDYRLVETVVGLRKLQTDYRLPPKAWFKRALKGVLPDWAMRRPKRGFTPPIREWHTALSAAYGSLLDGGYLVQAEVFRPESAQVLASGAFAHGAAAPLSFKALVLEMWCRQLHAKAQGFQSEIE